MVYGGGMDPPLGQPHGCLRPKIHISSSETEPNLPASSAVRQFGGFGLDTVRRGGRHRRLSTPFAPQPAAVAPGPGSGVNPRGGGGPRHAAWSGD